MLIRYILFFSLCVSIVALAELASILNTVPVSSAPGSAFWLFFGSIFLFILGISTLMLYGIKRILAHRRAATSIVVCVRQSALFAAVIVLSAFFNSLRILSIWDLIPLAISAILIEFFFQAEKAQPLSIQRDE
jgi:hypothetical protein